MRRALLLTAMFLAVNSCASQRETPDPRRSSFGVPDPPPRQVALLTTPPSNYKQRVIETADAEWRRWGTQFRSRQGPKESDRGYPAWIAHYWQIGTGREVRDTRIGWSGAFVSFVMKRAGAGSNWPGTGSHAHYIAWATENRKQRRGHFWAHRLNEYSPRPGDLVCNSLERGIDYDRQPGRSYASHCDVVVAVRGGEIEVIGGNLSNSVARRTLLVDSRGRLLNPQPKTSDPSVRNWFAVIENRL